MRGKLLSILMSVVLAAGLWPAAAFGEGLAVGSPGGGGAQVGPQAPAGSAEATEMSMDELNEQALKSLEADGGRVVQVSLGDDHSAAVKSDGSLWTWGRNSEGQLGDGTETDRSTPSKVMDGVAQVSLGTWHSAAVKSDGSLWTWGFNGYGQLGDGTETERTSPVKVMDGVAQASLGGYHTAAVKTDGSLWTWGRNYDGELGDGTTAGRSTPAKVMDGVAQVSLGSYHSAAIKSDGSLWTWGWNKYGQLGDGATTNRGAPSKVMDGVAQVSLGTWHSAALKSDGSLWTWGHNREGQLGDGTTADRSTPAKVMNGVTQVSLGQDHSAAVKTDGSLWTWGSNGYGRLGDGTETERTAPVKVMDGAAGVSLGRFHSAAIKTDGSLWTWGHNYYGQLGDGTQTTALTPKKISLSNTEDEPEAPSGLKDISDARIYINGKHSSFDTKINWTGKAIKPDIVVWASDDSYFGQSQLVQGTDYTVSFANNTNVGTATVTVTGKGSYTGSKTAEFEIVVPSRYLKYSLDDTYPMPNYSYRIPWPKCRNMFGQLYGFIVANDSPGTTGMCYGLVTTAICSSVYRNPTASSYSKDGQWAKKLDDVYRDWASSTNDNMSAGSYIESAQLAQYDLSLIRETYSTLEQAEESLSAFYDAAVDSVFNGAAPLCIAIEGVDLGERCGHALWLLGVAANNDLYIDFAVYDCNDKYGNAGTGRSLRLFKDGGGGFTGWEYVAFEANDKHPYDEVWGTGRENAHISWTTPGDDFPPMLDRNGEQDFYSEENARYLLSFLSRGDASITAKDGVQFKTGESPSVETEGIYRVRPANLLPDGSVASSSDTYWIDDTDSVDVKNVSEDATFSIASRDAGFVTHVVAGSDISVKNDSDGNPGEIAINQVANSRFSISAIESDDDDPCKLVLSGIGSDKVNAEVVGEKYVISGVTELTAVNGSGENTRKVNLDAGEKYTVDPGADGDKPVISADDASGPFEETPLVDISNARVSNISDAQYTGNVIQQSPVVKLGGKTLDEGWDYDVVYDDNVAVGTASVTIQGKGAYTGEIKAHFSIAATSLDDAQVIPIADVAYTGQPQEPRVLAKVDGRTLVEGEDFKVTYQNNVDVGKARAVITGVSNYTGTRLVEFNIVRGAASDISNASIAPIADQVYTGGAVEPVVTVTVEGRMLSLGVDYDVSYENNVKVGVASAVVSGRGSYSGVKRVSFNIVRETTSTSQTMHRLYNPNSGEHFYTASDYERDALVRVGWKSEGEGWKAPMQGANVYRMYNPNAGDHHYTTSAVERNALVKVGWKYEGVGWKSAGEGGVPLYRQYNPNARAGSHNYTTSKAENDMLARVGWREEGIGWYGL